MQLEVRHEGGRSWPVLVWRAGPGWRAVASSVVGGGIGPVHWWLNSMVPREYHRADPDRHLAEIAAGFGLAGRGVGMLTAADVSAATFGSDGQVRCCATVGLGWPVWAAAPEPERSSSAEPDLPGAVSAVTAAGTAAAPPPGTINLLVTLPVPLVDAALVNAVITATEAKSQALFEAGVAGSGTSSDAVCVACPQLGADGVAEPQLYAGPRSLWGARIARAVHAAVVEGTAGWLRERRA